MGAWIEIRGYIVDLKTMKVAPHMGAWIEIWTRANTKHNVMVAPHMGAWIEIEGIVATLAASKGSHPTWVRGLKWKGLMRRTA